MAGELSWGQRVPLHRVHRAMLLLPRTVRQLGHSTLQSCHCEPVEEDDILTVMMRNIPNKSEAESASLDHSMQCDSKCV